jgi:hypothetical protein
VGRRIGVAAWADPGRRRDLAFGGGGPGAGAGAGRGQFFLTTAATPWLDGKHVVFGRLVAGADVLRRMEAVGGQSGKPSRPVVVRDCGLAEPKKAK